jgi:hypothetical protein
VSPQHQFDRLAQVLDVPDNVVGAPSKEEWESFVEGHGCGFRLPEDYGLFLQRYGSGSLVLREEPTNWFMMLWSPFHPDPAQRFLTQCAQDLVSLKAIKSTIGDDFPFKLAFEPGGLLPWGGIEQGLFLCWETSGEPDDWPVVLIEDGYNTTRFDGGFAHFMHQAICEPFSPLFGGRFEAPQKFMWQPV